LAAGFQGEYWSTEGDNNTAITIKNITQKEAKAWPSFQYDSGRSNYEMQAMTLQPGESQMIDVKMLQIEKVPGSNGELLPETVTFGGMKLREEPGGRHFLIDAVVFNPRTATCGVCGYGCLYPESLVTIPGSVTLAAGGMSGALAVQANMCDSTHQTGWECSCDFVSTDTSIATINEFCTNFVTGIGSGSVLAQGTAAAIPGPHCGEQTLFTYCSVTIKPHISAISPAAGVPGIAYGVDITGTGFRTPATVSVAGTGISVSEVVVGSSTEMLATFTIASDATGGNHAVTVTANGQTSDNSVNFYVQIPTTIRQDGIDAITTCDPTRCTIGTQTNACGAYRLVHYTLVDQANPGQPIEEMATVTELVKDLSVPNDQGTPKSIPTNEAGAFDDLLAQFKTTTCPSLGESASVSQTFTATVGNKTFTLTRANRIDYMKSTSGQYSITLTVTTP
jgi:hypothetical protein